MELRHLRYAVAIAECGGLRAASERLNVAQPALSRQLRDLEAEVGAALFRRGRAGATPTDAGETFLARARAVLRDADAAAREARAVATGAGGRLRLGLIEPAAWDGAAPVALRAFARAWPDVALSVAPLSSLDQLQAIAAGDLDGGFVYRQAASDPPGVAMRRLRRDDVALAHAADLVFDHDGPLSVEDVDGLPLIGFPRESAPDYHDRLTAALRAIGLSPVVAQEAATETAILALVSAGVGSAFVNSANRARPPRNVQFRAVAGLSVPLELLFAHRDPPGEQLTRFLAVLNDIAEASI